MKTLHITSLIDLSGSYGGPTAVAQAQCSGLARLGHDVQLAAGWDGKANRPSAAFDTHLLRGWPVAGSNLNGRVVPALATRLRRLMQGNDVVHVHIARDLFTTPAALMAQRIGKPVILQPHGMLSASPRRLLKSYDRALLARTVRGARLRLALTPEEGSDLKRLFGGHGDVTVIDNGVEPSAHRAAWDGNLPEILYCGRLSERKRPEAFVRMAAILITQGLAARYRIVGPDSGRLGSVQELVDRLGLSNDVVIEGPVPPEQVRRRMAQAQVFVLPSFREPYPMAVLEALSVGLPSVITHDTGISSRLQARQGARVTDGTPEQLAQATAQLVATAADWAQASSDALAMADCLFSIDQVTERLDRLYRSVL